MLTKLFLGWNAKLRRHFFLMLNRFWFKKNHVNTKLKMWHNSKTQIVTKLKNSKCEQQQLKKLNCVKTKKKSICDKTKKIKNWQNSASLVVTKVKIKLKVWQISNSYWDQTQFDKT